MLIRWNKVYILNFPFLIHEKLRINCKNSEVFLTPGRPQSKTLSTIDEHRSKIDRNSVFDSHLSPVWRQMAIEDTVSIDFLIFVPR